jgi:tRNA A-37 threonylcarbamoyl transferase component Bud32
LTGPSTGKGRPPGSNTEVDPLIGRVLGERYRVAEQIGSGGMGVIYLAEHLGLGKQVAIKILREDLARDKKQVTRFHREAMAAAAIGHPNIVTVTDYGVIDDGGAFIVMERLRGGDLRTVLARYGAMQPRRCSKIARQVLQAIAAAHAQGIVHRDLKAPNIFLIEEDDEEVVKLLDFGISKLLAPLGQTDASGLTSASLVMGTPQYLAPEQAHGDADVDHRADIYSLGVVLYEMLTGDLPFRGRTAFEVMMKHDSEAPVPPSRRRPDLEIPLELDQIVLKAMEKDAADRFASADAMLEALDAAMETAAPRQVLSRPSDEPRPLGLRWVVGLTLALLVLAAGAVALWPDATEKRSPRATAPAREGGARERDGAVAAVPADVAAAAASADATAASADVAATVRLVLTVKPSHAQVVIDGRAAGKGSVRRNLARGAGRVQLEVRAPGYRTWTRALVRSRDHSLVVRLRRRAGERPAGTEDKDIEDNPYPRAKRQPAR